MRDKLFELYKQKHNEFKSIVETFPEDDLAGPFLMSPNDKYYSQKNRLLIIGQESGGWTYHVDDIEKQMDQYEEFNVGINYYPSPFWNITRKAESALKNELFSCAWTNISKFDLDGGRSHGQYAEAIAKLDYILLEEIKIISPKICLFYTGPSFDFRIEAIFDGVEFEAIPDWPIKQLCKLKHPQLPALSFRSHHPKSLRMRYLEDDFIEFISNLET